MTLERPGLSARDLLDGEQFEVLADEGEVRPGRRLVRLRLADGTDGWCDVAPHALGACLLVEQRTRWDLPDDLADATPLPVRQSACLTDVYEAEDRRPVVDLLPTAEGIDLVVHRLRARCEQAIAAFVERRGESISVLLQPEQMRPRAVARCACLYEVAVSVPLPTGTYEVTVETRGDRYAGDPRRSVLGRSRVSVG